MKDSRKAKPTSDDVAAAARLKAVWSQLARSRGLTQERMADELGITQGAVSQYLNGKIPMNYRTLRAFTDALGLEESSIRSDLPEQQLSMPSPPARVSIPATGSDYVRVQHLDAEAGMGEGIENPDNPEIIKAIDFEPGYIRSIVGFVPSPGRLRLITGNGDSMQPVIQPGDTVVVDTGITSFDGDGIYLINMGNGHQIKRLIDRGTVYVASENKSYGDPFPVPEGTLIGGKVYLRNRIERFN